MEFRFTLAGHLLALPRVALDTVIVLFGIASCCIVLNLGDVAFPGFASALSMVVYFLVDWGYGIALETAWSGQTVGKRAMGLRVIQESGVRIGFYHAALRNLARPVDRLPPALPGGRRRRARLALAPAARATCSPAPSSCASAASRCPRALGTTGEEGLLRRSRSSSPASKRLSTEEREVILSAALRREELRMEARLQLFSALGARLQDALAMEKPAHLSDEKWTLLVAAALLPPPEARKLPGRAGPRGASPARPRSTPPRPPRR